MSRCVRPGLYPPPRVLRTVRRPAGAALGASLLLACLAGCDFPGQAASPTPTVSSATCVVAATGHHAAVTFTGSTAGLWCQKIIGAGAGAYDFGITHAAATVCHGNTNDASAYVVTDDGGMDIGQTMCTQIQRAVFGGASPSAATSATP